MVLSSPSKAADFDLPGIDNKNHTLIEFKDKKALVVVFSCNHCPYVQAYEDRMIQLQREYGDKGLQIVAINANDSTNYPEDGFESMQQRAKEKKFNFPYLRDESQK